MRPLDLDQAIAISAYTGVLCCPLGVFRQGVQLRFGRAIGEREWPYLVDEIERAFQADFERLCVVPSQVEAFDD